MSAQKKLHSPSKSISPTSSTVGGRELHACLKIGSILLVGPTLFDHTFKHVRNTLPRSVELVWLMLFDGRFNFFCALSSYNRTLSSSRRNPSKLPYGSSTLRWPVQLFWHSGKTRSLSYTARQRVLAQQAQRCGDECCAYFRRPSGQQGKAANEQYLVHLRTSLTAVNARL